MTAAAATPANPPPIVVPEAIPGAVSSPDGLPPQPPPAAPPAPPPAAAQPPAAAAPPPAGAGQPATDDAEPSRDPSWLKRRLDRAASKAEADALRRVYEAFGVKTAAEFDAKLAAYNEGLRAAEDQRRAQMTESDRLKADLAAEKSRADKAEAELAAVREAQEAMETEAELRAAARAAGFIDEEVGLALVQRHVMRLPEAEQDAFDAAATARLFADLKARTPQLFRDYAPQPAAPTPTVPARTGTDGAAPAPAPVQAAPDDARSWPLQKWIEWKRANGIAT